MSRLSDSVFFTTRVLTSCIHWSARLIPLHGRATSGPLTDSQLSLADRYLEIEKHNGLLLSRLSKIAERKGVEGADLRPGKALQPGEAHPIVSKTYQNRKCACSSGCCSVCYISCFKTLVLSGHRSASSGRSWQPSSPKTRPSSDAFKRCARVHTVPGQCRATMRL